MVAYNRIDRERQLARKSLVGLVMVVHVPRYVAQHNAGKLYVSVLCRRLLYVFQCRPHQFLCVLVGIYLRVGHGNHGIAVCIALHLLQVEVINRLLIIKTLVELWHA